jgi:hypothetical protein
MSSSPATTGATITTNKHTATKFHRKARLIRPPQISPANRDLFSIKFISNSNRPACRTYMEATPLVET